MEGAVYLETLSNSTLDQKEVMVIDETLTCMTPIIVYLTPKKLSSDKKKKAK